MNSNTLIIFSVLLSGGCASLPQAIQSDPTKIQNVRKHNNRLDVLGTVSFAANRRTVLVSFAEDSMGKFCAEPPGILSGSIAAIQIKSM